MVHGIVARFSFVAVLLWPGPCPCRALSEAKGKRAQLPDDEPMDVSTKMCWTGDWTQEKCCQGDATTQADCWDDLHSFAECCPNADCWEGGSLTYEHCCDKEKFGETGNVGCWAGAYTYEHCCWANSTAQSWVDIFVGGVDTEQFYGMDQFYTDAQYGDDFGYYSTGRVLRQGNKRTQSTQQFAHYTTYPMALSPHFGRVVCRLLFIMWINLEERAPFRVVELGAGSGQLASDIRQCVFSNELGISPAVWRRWVASFEYLIIERSPALAQRQRERGLRVVAGDAQSEGTCGPALAALAASSACAPESSGSLGSELPECDVGASSQGSASVVLSNELLDAFAPVKLVLSTVGQPNVSDCSVWQEVRLVHTLTEKDLQDIVRLLRHSESRFEALRDDLQSYTSDTFCRVANSTVGKAAMECSPGSSCLAVAFGLSELLHHADLQLPSAAHNMRLRLKRDKELCERLRGIIAKLEPKFEDVVVLPRQVYQQLRNQMKKAPDVEVVFLAKTQTWQVPVPLSAARCEDMTWWFVTHHERVMRLVNLYRPLGYPAIQVLVRPGERRFVDLADCLIGSQGGFMLAVDYGAAFEALGHSLSVDPNSDGIFIPPAPQELLEGLPDCYASWPICAGRVDWTTFVDFTNMAAAGESLGWRTLAYGPQSLLEHMGRRNVTINGNFYSVPGYSVLAGSGWASNHVQNWYGHELLASKADTAGWQQRWTSFKALLLEKPASPSNPSSNVIIGPSWHLDSKQADPCWQIDPGALPLADWILRQDEDNPRAALGRLSTEVNDNLGWQYASAYEEAQLAVRMVDWLVATEGCENFRPDRAQQILNSNGLWLMLRTRLLRAWEPIWGEEIIERMAWAMLQRLAERPESGNATPALCLGPQMYAALCDDPGDAAMSRVPTYALP